MTLDILARAKNRMAGLAGSFMDWNQVRQSSHHLSGPRKIRLRDDEAALVCLLKNGAYYIGPLIQHHRNIGIRHFLIIDNGSDDDTVAQLAACPDVTVISNPLPVRHYESRLRAQVARQVVSGGWLLFVDSDELFDMPHGEGRDIGEYLRYCNIHGYDAVVGQCLDLFAPVPLAESNGWDYAHSVPLFDRFSLEDIRDHDYHDESVGFSWFLKDNIVTNPDIKLKFGGIRKEVFGENCALTNHRLVRNARHVRIYTHPHCSSNVRCADFAILLRHYKFAGAFLQRERQQMKNGTWGHGEDAKRMQVIDDLSFVITGRNMQRFTGTQQLVQQGFLACSPQFLARFPPLADPSGR